MKRTKTQKGITLVALIITIILLLILAVVTINAIQGGEGIIRHAQNARDEYSDTQTNETQVLQHYVDIIEEQLNIEKSHSGTIPKGGIYKVCTNFVELGTNTYSTTLQEGDAFPANPSQGDLYTYNDYEYMYKARYNAGWYGLTNDGWGLVYRGSSATPGQILSNINGKPVTHMDRAFLNIAWRMTSAPTVPSTIISMNNTFQSCSLLTGTITINANPTSYQECFSGTDMRNIALTGKCPKAKINAIGATGSNWTNIQ